MLRCVGLLTWAVMALPLVYEHIEQSIIGRPTGIASGPIPVFIGYVGFGISYYWLTNWLVRDRAFSRSQSRWHWVLTFCMSACALLVSYSSGSELYSILMMIIASVLPWMMSWRLGSLWLLINQLALFPTYDRTVEGGLLAASMQALLYCGLSMLTFVASLVTYYQMEAREEQRQLNAELRATRALLAENVRINERMRIARELHDVIGHQLAALSLNLEVSIHQDLGNGRAFVQTAYGLAKGLLKDVRETVSQIRQVEPIDLSTAVQALINQVPGLNVQFHMTAQVNIHDPEYAHTLLRCIQEILTNTIRHAQARNLWLSITTDDELLILDAHDDGRGASNLVPGNGLVGMRERLQTFGGTLEISTESEKGFTVQACINQKLSKYPVKADGHSI